MAKRPKDILKLFRLWHSTNKQTIINNSKKVYACMYQMVHYTFNELQKICQLGNTELCLALVQLMQENKIKQDRNEQGIYYVLNG